MIMAGTTEQGARRHRLVRRTIAREVLENTIGETQRYWETW
jgi:hypothetical protein